LKFSDVIIAAALLFVVGLVLSALLFVPFIPLKNYMSSVASIIAGLIASIIVGYLFAVQIREESRLRAIGSIVLLAVAGVMIFLVGWSANPLASPAFKDAMQSMFNTSGWTDYDWFGYTAFAMALDIIIFVVVGFVGLYVGSMLKPKKT
jgi:TctA family transporter